MAIANQEIRQERQMMDEWRLGSYPQPSEVESSISPPNRYGELVEDAININKKRNERADAVATSGLLFVTWIYRFQQVPLESRRGYLDRFGEIKVDPYAEGEEVGVRFGIDGEPYPSEGGLAYLDEPVIVYTRAGRTYSNHKYKPYGDRLIEIIDEMEDEAKRARNYGLAVDNLSMRHEYGYTESQIAHLEDLKSQSNNYLYLYLWHFGLIPVTANV